jgi:hypothetical protein
MQSKVPAAVFFLLFAVSGCASIGPSTVARDRFDYITAISDSWKSQTLLNLVKLRYGDAPVFLDVASVINQYAVEGSLGYSGSWTENPQLPYPFNALHSWSGAGRYTDKPTITYLPLSGEKFARNLMTPIAPTAILNLIQAGYPVDLVLRICVHAINGIHSRYGGAARLRQADPEFYPLIERLRKIQLSGNIGMRLEKSNDRSATLIVLRRGRNAEMEADAAAVRKILGIDSTATELAVVYGSVPANDKEIALQTRSMLEILIDLGSYIRVPATSVEERRTYPTPPPETANGVPVPPLLQIASSSHAPQDAFATVPYRQGWYWIDDKDFRSKITFSFIMFLFSLTETEGRQGAPVITLPAG